MTTYQNDDSCFNGFYFFDFYKIKVNCVLAVRDSFYSLLQQLNFFGNKTCDKKFGEFVSFFFLEQ